MFPEYSHKEIVARDINELQRELNKLAAEVAAIKAYLKVRTVEVPKHFEVRES